MTFTVKYFPQAEAFLRKAEKHVFLRIDSKINEVLAQNPFQGARKVNGKARTWRYRIGDYRVLYQVDTTNKMINVYAIGKRENIYDRI